MVKRYNTPVYDRVGHVIKGTHGKARKIYAGYLSLFDESIMWHHMPCLLNEKGTYTIVGPMFAECGGFRYYWITEESVAKCELISTEEITEDDKHQLTLPNAPPCETHWEQNLSAKER